MKKATLSMSKKRTYPKQKRSSSSKSGGAVTARTNSRLDVHPELPQQAEHVRRPAALIGELRARGAKVGRPRRVGIGIAQATVVPVDPFDLIKLQESDPSSIPLVGEVFAAGWPTPLEVVDRTRKYARELLKARDLPDTDSWIKVSGKGWTWAPKGEAPQPPKKDERRVVWKRGLELAVRHEGAPEWYAAQLLRTSDQLTASLQQVTGQAQAIAFHSFRFGWLLAGQQWNLKHEAPALSGRAQAKKLKEMSWKGTASQKRKGQDNYHRVLVIARKQCKARPDLFHTPYKLAETVHAENSKRKRPLKGNSGATLCLSTIFRHIKLGIGRGELTAKA
jgi:hypothetical protein